MRFAFLVRTCAVVVCLAVAAGPLGAAAPRFTQLLPRGVQRGQEVELTLSGTNLADAEELMLYDSGLEILSFSHPEKADQVGKELKVRVRVAADCPLGTQRMRVRTRTGLSELQNLNVGSLPIVDEKEPNTDFQQPQGITQNVTVHGRIDREDVDYFVVEAKQGQRLTAEVLGMRLGYSTGNNFFDPYLAILNEDRFELAVADDTTLVHNDAVVSIIVPADGKYIIQLRDAAYQGDSRAYYLLSVGNFPRPLGVVPSGGRPGEKLTVTFVGDVLGPMTREITLPAELPDPFRFGIEVQDEYGIAPSLQPFRVSDLAGVVEQEPNNDRNTATAGEQPGAFHGVIGEPGDIDFFKFTAKKDVTYEVQVYARRLRSPLDPVLSIYSASGQGLGSNDDTRGPDSRQNFKAPADGEYVVAVRDHLKNGGPDYTYRIEVTPVEPSLYAAPIEFARYVQSNIEIPRGSGVGLVVNVRRDNFGGPVHFRSDDLPPGVRIEAPEGWREQGEIPLVFYADEQAPVGGRYSSIVAHLADPKQPDRKIEAPLIQDMLMIRAQNNDRVWEERISRQPVVVTEKLPFRVWIEAPPVPLVRGGSMNLVVKCEKDEGFDEEISVLVLKNPSGVNSSTSAKIPKGQTETVILLNAAGNAAVAESMIAVRGFARVNNGNVNFCTPFVPLRVEEPYVNFKFAQGAVSQGQETAYVVTVEKRKDFEGEAEVKLVGLPANAVTEPLKFTKDTAELIFTIKAAENTPVGMTKNLLCQVLIPEAGGSIPHNLGSGVLRVDPPPPKPKDPAAAPPPVAKAAPGAKPLSRLEQLRLEQQQRVQAEAAAGSGGGGM